MRYVSIDSETDLIRPGRIAPPLTCVSIAERVDGRVRSGLLGHVEGIRYVRSLLEDENVTLIGHNFSYDLAVFAAEDPSLLPLIFRTIAAKRVADTMLREQLILIARGDMAFTNERIKLPARLDPSESHEDEGEDDDGESSGWKRVKKNYTLAGLSAHYLRRTLDKGEDGDESAIRLTFGPWRGVPLDKWPADRAKYAVDDAIATLEIFEAQAPRKEREGAGLPEPDLDVYVSPDERMQVAAAFALHLCAVRGVRTDGVAIAALEKKLTTMQAGLGQKLLGAGLLKAKSKRDPTLSRDMKAIRALVEKAYAERGLPLPLTPKGSTSTAKDTIEAAADYPYPERVPIDERAVWLAGMPVKIKGETEPLPGCTVSSFVDVRAKSPGAALEPLVAFANCQKILGTYVKPMKGGIDGPLSSRPNTLVESGRTSWGAMIMRLNGERVRVGANWQNLPRMPGVRECLIPRPGFVLASVDYDSIELRTLAQAMIKIVGRSTLADRYNADPNYDPHTAIACRLAGGISYDEGMRRKAAGDKEIKRLRQLAKVPNFGLPGGMSAKKLVIFAWKTYGLRIREADAEHLKRVWFQDNPEMKAYFDFISSRVEVGGPSGAVFTQWASGRKRGGCGFCDGANYFFQGSAADGGKLALFAVSWEAYCNPESPLFGSRPLIFVHDEIIAEVPEAGAHEAATRLTEIMIEQMRRVVTDVPVTASPALMRRWYKNAEAVYEGGRLIPWEPRA